MDASRTEETKREQKRSRYLLDSEKDRKSLEALRALADADADRPSLRMFFLLEVVKWGGMLFIAYIVISFFFLP